MNPQAKTRLAHGRSMSMSPPIQQRNRAGLARTVVTFIKFGAVGGLGTIINLGFFFVAADLAGLNATACSMVGFALAVTSNYLLNAVWTFRPPQQDGERTPGDPPTASLRAYARYVVVNLAGLAVNLAVLHGVLTLFAPPWKVVAQAAGIAAGTLVNYAAARLFVFRV